MGGLNHVAARLADQRRHALHMLVGLVVFRDLRRREREARALDEDGEFGFVQSVRHGQTP